VKKSRVQILCLIITLITINSTTYAAPAFSRGTSIQGAIAYQDAGDATQFWYFPTSADQLLGERLRAYRVTHFGYGKAYYVQDDQGRFHNATGGIVSGTFAYDLSPAKRTELVKAIQKAFNVANPKLIPLPLRSPKVTSVLLAGVFGQFGKVEQNIPAGFQIGPEVAFSAGSASSLFAAVLANAQLSQGIQPNPAFSLNIEANAEFVGDPWTYDVDCDLAQVWRQVRRRGSTTVNLGWFRIGSAEYQGTWQDLNKANVCTFNQVEGSLDTAKFGRQLAETMKQIFQAINDKAVNGEGFFRFEPNPEAPPPGGGGGFSLFGIGISVNAGYSEAFFSQTIRFHRRITYTGRLEAPIAFSAVMAVACGPETKQFFADLGDASESCITQPKIDTFLDRAKREKAAKDRKLLELTERLARGEITEVQYEKIKAVYDQVDFTDTFVPTRAISIRPGVLPRKGMALVSELSDRQIRQLEKKAIASPTIPNPPSPRINPLKQPRRLQ